MVGDPGGANGGGETPSIANISSGMLLDIGIGGEPSGVELCRAISERSLIGWVRGPNSGMSSEPISMFLHRPAHEGRRPCDRGLIRLFHPYCDRDPLQEVVRQHTEYYTIVNERLRVIDHVRLQLSHELVKVVIDCLGA